MKYSLLSLVVLYYFLSIFVLPAAASASLNTEPSANFIYLFLEDSTDFPIDADDLPSNDNEPNDDSFELEELYWSGPWSLVEAFRSYSFTYKAILPMSWVQRQFKPPKP